MSRSNVFLSILIAVAAVLPGCTKSARVHHAANQTTTGRILGSGEQKLYLQAASGTAEIERDTVTRIVHPGETAQTTGLVLLVAGGATALLGSYFLIDGLGDVDSDVGDGGFVPLGIGLLSVGAVSVGVGIPASCRWCVG